MDDGMCVCWCFVNYCVICNGSTYGVRSFLEHNLVESIGRQLFAALSHLQFL